MQGKTFLKRTEVFLLLPQGYGSSLPQHLTVIEDAGVFKNGPQNLDIQQGLWGVALQQRSVLGVALDKY
jgi:hypothetical protein